MTAETTPSYSQFRTPYPGCPLCGGADIPVVARYGCTNHALYRPELPPHIDWCRCGQCGHIFTAGYFTAEACELLFGTINDGQQVGQDAERQRSVSARMVQRVAAHVSPGGAWLDVGFGNGALLFAAEEWGYAPVGLDLRPGNVDLLKRLGYEAHCTRIEEFDHPGRFNVISMADVLEHMPFPKAGLRAAHRLLRLGGALFLSMPNTDTPAWEMLTAKDANPYWGEMEHYHNFGRRRLNAALEECGFTPVDFAVSDRFRLGMEIVAIRTQ